MQIELITTADGFSGLRDNWLKLFAKMRSNNLFIHYDWMRIWLDCQGDGKKLRLFVVRMDNKVVGIAPLMLRSYEKSGFKYNDLFLMTAYDDPFSEKGVAGGIDFLWDPEYDELKHQFAAYILDKTSDWCYLRLHPIQENSSTISAFRDAAVQRGIKVKTPYALKNVYLDIKQDWETYFSERSSNLRKSLRRGKREIEARYTRTFKEFRRPKEVEEGLDKLMTIEKNSWKVKRGFGIDSDELNSFYFEIARYFSKSGNTMIWVMFADEHPIAYELHVKLNGYIRTLKGSYDDGFKRFSVGNQLIAASCEAFFKRGLKQVDMMWGSLDYKQKWSKDLDPHVGVYLLRDGLYSSFIEKLYNSPKLNSARKTYRRLRKRVLGRK